MAAKTVHVSSDDITYFLLPGGTGELTREGRPVTDTIFGQTFESQITGPITWGVNANALYKGFAGYVAKLLKQGTSTAMTAEPTTFISGKTYQITNTARRVINRAATLTILDNAIDHTADVEKVDFLFGKVTFKSTYTVIGPVTITGSFFPMATLAAFQSFSLTQTAVAINDSDMPTLQANGGFESYKPGLRTVALELPAVFQTADNWHSALINRSEYVIEINPDGTGAPGSIARGFFRLMQDSQAGDVGQLEVETLRFALNVPIQSTGPALELPFNWEHGASSPIPTGVQKILQAWEDEALIYVRYLHNGVAGWKGQSVVNNITLNAGMDTPNVFTANFTGKGAPIVV